MNVIYHDNIKQSPEIFAAVKDATSFLENNLGPSGSSATIEWDVVAAPKRPIKIGLRISDGPHEVATQFEPDILNNPHRIRFLVLHCWGDLLQMRSEVTVAKLQGRELGVGLK